MSAMPEIAHARYTVRVVYTQDDFIGLLRACTRKTARLRVLGTISKVGFRLAGALLVLAGVANLIAFLREGAQALPAAYALLSLCFLTAGVFLLLRKDSTAAGRRMWQRYPDKGSAVDYAFFDAEFTASKPGQMSRFVYSAVEAVYTDGSRWFLFTDGNNAHIIAKGSLAPKGDVPAFSAFLREKTGREIAEI